MFYCRHCGREIDWIHGLSGEIAYSCDCTFLSGKAENVDDLMQKLVVKGKLTINDCRRAKVHLSERNLQSEDAR